MRCHCGRGLGTLKRRQRVDTNVVVLTGGPGLGRPGGPWATRGTLTELRLACTCPGRKGEGETQTVLPVTIWAGDVGATGREMPEGTPRTVVGRLSAREYHIVIPGDLQDVARRPRGTFSGTLRGEAIDGRPVSP